MNDLDTEQPDLCPVGHVLMWTGDEASVPEGWAIANGENGTDDWTRAPLFVDGEYLGNGLPVSGDGCPVFYYIQRIA